LETRSTDRQSTEPLRTGSRRRSLVMAILLSLDAFVLGGFVALLIVNRLLNSQLDLYVTAQLMPAASAILDFMDDLLPVLLIYSGILLLLVLATASIGVWLVTESRWLRWGVILLWLAVFVVLAGLWLSRGAEVPVVPPTTPTPLGSVTDGVQAIL
jgi:hypothetical protein